VSHPLSSIRNVIFDLGGVILNIDYDRTVQAFELLGFTGFGEIFSQRQQLELFSTFERGQITPEEFRASINRLSPLPLKESDIDAAWNAMLLDLPEERMELIERVRQTHRTFLLSNTNVIHIEAFISSVDKQHGAGRFNALFDTIYYSSSIGMRKPDAEIFEFVLRENDLAPEETLFIDDFPWNVEAARKTGINAVQVSKEHTIVDLLKL